jgi:tetratricopeptide (TPR) repeat protein
VFALALALSATGAWADMNDDCKQSADPDLRIRGCTQVIGRGKRERREYRAIAYNNRGLAYQEKGEVDRAIANFTTAIKFSPNDARVYSNRGSAYATKGELDRAIANLSKAIALNPKYADAYNSRGVAYAKKGDKEQAIADFRKALEIRPSDQDAKNNLKRLGAMP